MQKFNEFFVDNKREKFKKWNSLVNMSVKELDEFLKSKEGKEAGLSRSQASELGIKSGRDSARAIIRMKQTPVEKWTDNDWKWCARQISFISRMKGNPGPLYDEKKRKTRKHTALLVWGHDPEK